MTQLITYALVPSTVYARDRRFDDEQLAGDRSFSDSGWRRRWRSTSSCRERAASNDNPNGTTFEQQTSMVGTGRAAMAVQVSAVLLGLPRRRRANRDDISMFPFPGAEDPADNLDPRRRRRRARRQHREATSEAGARFLAYLGEPENMNRWASAVAAIPLVRDDRTRIDPALEPFLPYIDDNKADPVHGSGAGPTPRCSRRHFAVIRELLAGKTDVAGALQKMDERTRSRGSEHAVPPSTPAAPAPQEPRRRRILRAGGLELGFIAPALAVYALVVLLLPASPASSTPSPTGEGSATTDSSASTTSTACCTTTERSGRSATRCC